MIAALAFAFPVAVIVLVGWLGNRADGVSSQRRLRESGYEQIVRDAEILGR